MDIFWLKEQINVICLHDGTMHAATFSCFLPEWLRFGEFSGMTLSEDQMVHQNRPNFSNFIFSPDGISRLEGTGPQFDRTAV